MAMRLYDNELEFCAPYGFQDAFTMRVRPNKVLTNRGIYEDKAFRWREQWPKLKVFDW